MGVLTPVVGKGSLSNPGPPPASSNWSATGLGGFFVAFLLSSLLGALRVGERFRQSSGLGIFSSLYTWSFVAFTALLSGLSYVGLGELAAGLSNLGKHFSLGFMSALAIGGGSGAGHILLAVGRLLPRSRPAPPSSTQPQELCMPPSSNVILMFFHNGIYNHLSQRFQLQTEKMAKEFDWTAVRTATTRLIQAEIAIGRLTDDEGNKVISQIGSLPAPSTPEQDYENRYQALCWAIRKSSFSQVRSRLLSGRIDPTS